MKKMLITNKVTTHFFITPFKSTSYTLHALPTAFSRIMAVSMLTACATYQAQPLDQSPPLAISIEQLQTHTDRSAHPELPQSWRDRTVNVKDGLDEMEVGLLAVLNSPHLRAAHAQLNEAQAQLIEASLLPDPQLTTSADFPAGNDSALVTGFNFGLGFDLQSLLTRGARRDAATEQARATYLNVLWQEWQIIQQARLLYRRVLIEHQQIKISHDRFLLAKQVWDSREKALKQGNITLDQARVTLASLESAQATWTKSRRQMNAAVHELTLLLGLSPSSRLLLSLPPAGIEAMISPPSLAEPPQSMLVNMAKRRPDLLALQAGYNSQEATVREQILAQFPNLSVGANRTRDTGNVWTIGPFINLGLPVLNGNRGKIAVARATRQRLYEEYRDRLATAYMQALKLDRDQRLVFAEWKALTARLSGIDKTVRRMDKALQDGNLDMLTYANMRSAYIAQQAHLLTLKQTLLEQQVAVETLTGTLLGPAFHTDRQGE